MLKVISLKSDWFAVVVESSFNQFGEEYTNCEGLRTTGPNDTASQFYTHYRNVELPTLKQLVDYMTMVECSGYGGVIFGPAVGVEVNKETNIGIYTLGKDWKPIHFKETFGAFDGSDITSTYETADIEAIQEKNLSYLQQRIEIKEGKISFKVP